MSTEAKIVLSHPTGNANVRALAEGLLKNGILQRFITSVALFPDSPFYRFTSLRPFNQFRKREYAKDLQAFTEVHPMREMGRLLFEKFGNSYKGYSIDDVYKDLDLYVSGRIKSGGIYSYEDGAIESFKQAKLLGMPCFYDLPIGYWRAMHQILEKERMERPEWAPTLPNFLDSDEKLKHKDEELKLADHIFVASSFTAESLKKFPGTLAPVSIVPYGFPKPDIDRNYSPLASRKLRVLFVGGLSQRKGIAQMFEAVKKMKNQVDLTVVGKKSTAKCEVLEENLSQHKWIPDLPHSEILKLMQSQDLLLFPSLFEGFGLVITEAMSQGTPVITTERTCGGDLIDHGNDGWLIEAGSTEALVKQLEEILSNPDVIEQVGRAAMEKAKKRPWNQYGEDMGKELVKIFQKKENLEPVRS